MRTYNDFRKTSSKTSPINERLFYHKHNDMDYDIMTNLVTETIKNLFKNDLV